VVEKILRYIRDYKLLAPGERVAIAISGGADSVALLRVLLELRQELGINVSVAHFHHKIRGSEADEDQQFVSSLAQRHDLAFYFGCGDAPAYSRDRNISLETAARELRHEWFAELITSGRADKIATGHTLDDQAETVLMRVLRGSGSRGLAGISPVHVQKGLVRPLLQTRRQELEKYLAGLNQPWREDSSNRDLRHTRNRVRHTLIPLLEREFNPAIRETLSDLAGVARAEADYWEAECGTWMERLVRQGKPSRSGRSTTGDASQVWSVDLKGFCSLPLALQRQVLRAVGGRTGREWDFQHVEEVRSLAMAGKRNKKVHLPGEFTASCTFRELQITPAGVPPRPDYEYSLPVPGEVSVSTLGSHIRARVIASDELAISGYNPALLLDRARLAPELIVRNWRAGDRFFPAHTQSPKKVKELLQTGRLGQEVSDQERKAWPVIQSGSEIVWMRGFPVPAAYAPQSGDAVLIEEISMNSKAADER